MTEKTFTFNVNRSPVALTYHRDDVEYTVYRVDTNEALVKYAGLAFLRSIKPARQNDTPGDTIEVAEYVGDDGVYAVQWKQVAAKSRPNAQSTGETRRITARIPFIVRGQAVYPDVVTPRDLLLAWGFDLSSAPLAEQTETLPSFSERVPQVFVEHPQPFATRAEHKRGQRYTVYQYSTSDFRAPAPLQMERFYPGALPKVQAPAVNDGLYVVQLSKEWHLAVLVYSYERQVKSGTPGSSGGAFWRTYKVSLPNAASTEQPVRLVKLGDVVVLDE